VGRLSGAHAASAKLTMAATTNFEGAALSAQRTHRCVIIKAKADGGHPQARESAPRNSNPDTKSHFATQRRNSLRCGNAQTSRLDSLRVTIGPSSRLSHGRCPPSKSLLNLPYGAIRRSGRDNCVRRAAWTRSASASEGRLPCAPARHWVLMVTARDRQAQATQQRRTVGQYRPGKHRARPAARCNHRHVVSGDGCNIIPQGLQRSKEQSCSCRIRPSSAKHLARVRREHHAGPVFRRSSQAHGRGTEKIVDECDERILS